MSITDAFIGFAGQNPILVGIAIFVAAFLESIPFVGSIFPGSATVLVLSGAMGAAGAPIPPIVIWGSAGGLFGDILGFWLGRRYGLRLREMWPFKKRPALWDQVAGFLARHAGKSVILSRFVPGARAVTPIAAGALGMKAGVFLFWSIPAALVWALVYVIPAAATGQLLSSIGQISGRLVAAVLTVIVSVSLAIWLASIAATFAGPRLYQFYRRQIGKMERSSNPFARRVGASLDPTLATIGQHLLWGIVLLGSAIGLFGILENILASTQIIDLDSSVRAFAQSLRSTPIDQFMVGITAFGDGLVIAICIALLCLGLLLGRAYRTAAIVAIVFAATFVFLPIMNSLLRQEYPVVGIHPAFLTTTFPSSHATLVTLYCGVAAALATQALGIAGRMVAWSLALAFAVLVGLSRIYLDVQWPSDVAGGLLLGLSLTAIFAMIRTGFEQELGTSLRFPLLAAALLLVVGGVNVTVSHADDLLRYAPRAETRALIDDFWRSEAWREMPAQRVDLLGTSEEPISLQVAASPARLAEALAPSGWTLARPFKLRDLLLFLSVSTPMEFVPPLPLMESGRLPVATLVRDGGQERRLVIRLWPTEVTVQSDGEVHPLLLGSITEEKIVHPYDAATTIEVEPAGDNFRSLLDEISKELESEFHVTERSGEAGPVLLITPR